jgi:glucosylglycerate synthase
LERLSHGVLSDDAAALLDGDRPVDVLVGIPSFQNARTIGHVVRAVEAGLRKHFPDRRCLIAVSDGNSTDGTVEAAMAATTEGDEELLLLDPKADRPDRLAMTYVGLSGKGSAFRAIFELAAAVGARGCAVLDADLRSVSPSWIDRLVGPVLEHGHDLVTPLYARHKPGGGCASRSAATSASRAGWPPTGPASRCGAPTWPASGSTSG